MLDIYVVSLSSSWISDSTLTTLMGRVPARCIVLLEDLDAAFTRSTSRDGSATGSPENSETTATVESSESRHSRRHKDNLSDVNTLSLSGLLNALDGVAASEGRILFATTNHLERLDPALSRPGRMDVWVEFRNASKWQAELLFRNFFPSTDDDNVVIEGDLDGVELPTPPSPLAESASSLSSLFSLPSTPTTPSATVGSLPSAPPTPIRARTRTSSSISKSRVLSPDDKIKNQAYLPPPVDDEIAQHSAKPLDGATLAALAKEFADAIPDEEFSVAALQGYLLKNKSRPEAGAHEAAAWVVSEREMKVRLKKEREAREAKEKQEREKRRKEAQLKDKEKAEQKKKEDEEVHRRLLEERIRVEKAKLEAEAAGSTPESIADTEGSATEDKDEQSGDEQSSGSQTPAEAGQVWVTVNESAP